MFFDYVLPIIISAAIAAFIGLILCFASIKFAVKNDPLYDQIKEIIGEVNCGGCGYAGCAGYSKALATFEDGLGKCRPMKKEAYDKIDKILKDAKEQKAAELKANTVK